MSEQFPTTAELIAKHDLRDRIADVAVEHQIEDDHPEGGWICTCGREFLLDDPSTFQSWDEHLADAVIATLGLRREGETLYGLYSTYRHRHVTEWENDE